MGGGKQSIETHREMVSVKELLNKDNKTVILTVFQMFKKLKARLNMLNRNIKKYKKHLIQTSGNENYDVWMKNALNGTKIRLDIEEERLVKTQQYQLAKMTQSERITNEPWDNSTCVIRVPGWQGGRGGEKYLKK